MFVIDKQGFETLSHLDQGEPVLALHSSQDSSPQPPPSTPEASSPNVTQRLALLWQLGRHQLASLAATAVDFGTMIFVAKVLSQSAVLGTALGASLGALVNFSMGRAWIFTARNAQLGPQAVRYILISTTSLGLNVLGEYLLLREGVTNFVLARVLVAGLVSVLWNFPMQRNYVFRSRGEEKP